MKITKATVEKFHMPPGKTDHIEFDEDLPGFGIRLRAGGKRTWVIQYRVDAGQRRVTIGDVKKIDADKARAAAKTKLAEEVTLGGDPQDAKHVARARAAITLAAKREAYLARKKDEVRKGGRKLRARTYEEIERYLTVHWQPLAGVLLHKVTRRDIAARLTDITKESGPIAAARARSALSGFFAWAMGEGFLEANPIMGTNKPAKSEARDRVLAASELAAVWAACREDDYGRIVRLLILTGQRRDDVGRMSGPELDLEAATWSLPGDRTKNGQPHMIPLSDMALAIIQKAPRREGRAHLFGGRGPFSGWSAAKAALDRRILEARQEAVKQARQAAKDVKAIEPWTVHDLRRTVSTLMHELGVEPHIVEAVLNHLSGHRAGVAGTYNHALYAPQKRAALALWADHVRSIVEGGEQKIVAFPPRAAVDGAHD